MPWYPSWIFVFWQLLSRGTCSCRSNKCGQFIAWAEYCYFTFIGNLMVNLMQKETQTQLLMWVSIFEWKGGGEGRCWWVTGIGLAFQVFSNFFFQFPDPWDWKLVQIWYNPFSWVTKPQFGQKFVVKIPTEGTKQVFKYHTYTYAHIPFPRLNVDICITNTTWKQAKEHLK